MTTLNGLKAVEVSGDGSAAMGGKHLADWGAHVTMIEPASGSPLRDEPPYYEKDGERKSATWAWLSIGKAQQQIGDGFSVEDARALCEQADVVLIEKELSQDVLGLAPSDVAAAFAGKTTCVLISPFATDGPYADYKATDLGLNAMGGWMHLLGDPAREPLRPGGGIIPRVSGLSAVVSALIGLRHVQQGGQPQFVDLSQQAVAASMIVAPWLVKSMVGIEHGRRGNTWPMGVMECKDGFIGCPPLTPGHWDLICQLMGIADVLELPDGRDIMYRMTHGEELYERVKPWLNARTRDQIIDEAQAFRLPAAPVQTIADRLACPQLKARDFWRTAEIDGTTVKVPRVTYFINGLEPADRLAGPPNETEPSPPLRSNGQAAPKEQPFAGLRVLDLTSLWSGPYAMMLLGALGADVIKVESIQRPDPYRYTFAPPGREHRYEWAPLWNDSNCNKRDITLDLTSERGRELVKKLIAQADIVISNFSNRVMPNLGLTNDKLLEINPNVIAVTMPGYGQGGPWEEYVGYAVAFEQLVCGSMTGYADGEPSYAGGFCDPMVGLHVISSIILALQQREETGKGTEIELPQCETLDSLFAPEQIAVQMGAPVPSRRGNKHEWMAPHDAYRVAGEDEWITIAVATDEEFAAFAEGIGAHELARDERFASAEARKQNEAALDEAITNALKERDGVELEQELQKAGVAACRVRKGFDLPDDAGLQHIGFFQKLTRKITDTQSFKTWPFRFSSIDASHKSQPPLLGEHNAEVLRELLGLSDEEIAQLETDQVIGTEPLGLAAS
ncbi:MAG: CoA transferase [Chloroflexi bacterium]|nr:CoA transferase [Chloroflexota bacterium]